MLKYPYAYDTRYLNFKKENKMELEKINTFSKKQLLHTADLIKEAVRLDWDLTGYGSIGYNTIHGNTYIWSENEPYSLFISYFNEPKIQACWSNPENGNEIFINTENMNAHELDHWSDNNYKNANLGGETYKSVADECRNYEGV